MNEERITDLFGRLKDLPSEVPFGEVEQWARLHAAGQLLPQAPHIGAPAKLPWYSFKPPLYMTSIITAAAASGLAAIIAISTTDEDPQPQPNNGLVALADSTIILQQPIDSPVVEVKVKPAPNGDTTRREYTINAPANAQITISATEGATRTQLNIDNGKVNIISSENDSFTYQYDPDTKDDKGDKGNKGDKDPSGDYTFTINRSANNHENQCVCSNNNEEVQREFVKQLLADGLIDSDKRYHFFLDDDKFSVNGKRQSDTVHQKYLRLYEKLSGGSTSGSFYWQVQVSPD